VWACQSSLPTITQCGTSAMTRRCGKAEIVTPLGLAVPPIEGKKQKSAVITKSWGLVLLSDGKAL
jgi:hypothetical protein